MTADMVTISQIQKMHAQSILASGYVNYKMSQHFDAARLYWEETTGNSVHDLPGTAWIRLSTGKLCLDIGDGVKSCWKVRDELYYGTPTELPSLKLTEDELHAKLLCVLKFDEFYPMVTFSRRYPGYDPPSSTESITLPSIWISGDWADFKSNQLLAIPFPNHVTPNEIYIQPWEGYSLQCEGMPTGWTRWVSELLWTIILMEVMARVEYQGNPNLDSHHLAAYGGIEDHAECNVATWFMSTCKVLLGTFMTDAPSSKVHLFLLNPQVEVLDGQLTVINPPDAEKYYWSFDPAGLDQLTHETAEDIGLPTPKFTIESYGLFLEEEETNLIREFHAAKGFDPESQDVAIAMRYPLLTEQHSMIGPETDSDEVEDKIYYSLALC
ncbi:hypothetical protein DFH08DRAFT_825735 [Mycena albidolilacea]|uniref:Uncharacterized protein n=1 Tax=Mycena albidolilacea TaxID=1033008 RepID=A0AAD6Z1R0_9AGAR|nr:hypothetical protein DFH08DRAFT_825735 [Mycena albidolilacea]